MQDDKTQKEKEEEMEYVGNMWGWRFSYISLAIILVFFVLFLISECQHSEVPVELPE